MERGLAVVGSYQPPQSLIVYATAPGKTALEGEGRNGVFTSAFLKHVADPGLDAELMLRRVRDEVIAVSKGAQIPWQNSSISGSGFAFAGGGKLLIATDPTGAEIFVDGQRRGVSPLSLSDLPRFVEIEIAARSGSRSVSRRLILKESDEKRLDLKLEVLRGSIRLVVNEPAATFYGPQATCSDGSSLFVADTQNWTIRKIDIATGAVSILAGFSGQINDVDGIGALVYEGSSLFYSDAATPGGPANAVYRLVLSTGQVTRIAGSTESSTESVDGFGTESRFVRLLGICAKDQCLYIIERKSMDENSIVLRKIDLASLAVVTITGPLIPAANGLCFDGEAFYLTQGESIASLAYQ